MKYLRIQVVFLLIFFISSVALPPFALAEDSVSFLGEESESAAATSNNDVVSTVEYTPDNNVTPPTKYSPDNDVLVGTDSDTGQFNDIPEYVNDRSGWVAESQDYWRDYKGDLGDRVSSGEISPAGATVRHTWATVADWLITPFDAVENSAGKLGHDVGHDADAWTITKDSAALAGNSVFAGAALYPGASLLRGGKVATAGGSKVIAATGSKTTGTLSKAQYLEYQALRRQGYKDLEARNLMSQFDKGINPGNNWAYHYTSEKAAGNIVKSGEIWASKNGARGAGTYAGNIPNATGFQKTTQWYLTPGTAPVRIPVNKTLQSGVIDDVAFPVNTTIFRDGVKLAQ